MAKTYETYKDSGIAWIGEIPGEWKVKKARHIFTQRNSKGNKTPTLLSATQINGMYPQHLLEGVVQVQKSTDLQTFKTVHKNDYVISLRSFQGGFEMSDYEGVCSPAYQVFYNKIDICHQYYKLLFKSQGFISMINSLVVGIREGKNIQYGSFSYSYLPFPPLSVQQSISSFLNTKCGEIDSLISIQEEMISELLAYKQSVITEAVTKGLDKKAKMKNSGVEWIGDIPEEWEVQKLRTLGWCQNGISKSGDYFGEDYEYPFVSYPDAYKNFEVPYPKGRANSTLEDRQRYSLIKGDVLFTRTSETIEEIGFASTCTETIPNAVFSGFLIRFRPTSPKIYYGYSKYFFRSIIHRAFFVKEMNLVTRASLSQDLLKNLPVVLPKIEEQQAIATYLDEKTTQIDSLIALKQSKIESLKEYKKSIIYEYVTGKKRV